jgi:hypothetical protein
LQESGDGSILEFQRLIRGLWPATLGLDSFL